MKSKCQSSKFKWRNLGGAEKRALSANLYFFGNHYQAIGAAGNSVLGRVWRNRRNGRKNMFEQRRASFSETSFRFTNTSSSVRRRPSSVSGPHDHGHEHETRTRSSNAVFGLNHHEHRHGPRTPTRESMSNVKWLMSYEKGTFACSFSAVVGQRSS